MSDLKQLSDFIQESPDESHTVAWRYGASIFGYCSDKMPKLTGLLISESPDRNSNPYLPLFPHPENTSGARLLGWSNLPYEDYIGRLVRANLYEFDHTSDQEADQRANFLKEGAADRQLRVLLLGRLVRDVFGCTQDFGIATLYTRWHKPIRTAWIPHPSGLNKRFHDEEAQKLAGSYVRWAAGGKEP